MSVTTYRAVIRRGKVEAMGEIELPDGTEVYVVASPSLNGPAAKRIANRWLISAVGNLLMADSGSLVESALGWVWRFEVFCTSVAHKPWGPIGALRVDAATGAILDPEQTKTHLYERARTYQPPA